jgi:REP element-mobilizing transposase RayT
MPDHLHVLVEGTTNDTDFKAFMKLARMRAAVAVARGYRYRLWQDGYFEHVLRDEETTPAVVAYIIANPLRAGLVKCVDDYPFTYILSTYGRPSDAGAIDDRRS